MKIILEEDVPKMTPDIEKVIRDLGNGAKKTEYESEITVGDPITVANVRGYWVGDLLRIDIKFHLVER